MLGRPAAPGLERKLSGADNPDCLSVDKHVQRRCTSLKGVKQALVKTITSFVSSFPRKGQVRQAPRVSLRTFRQNNSVQDHICTNATTCLASLVPIFGI
ncbi:hypothetical protein RRG08_060676 [Elysia crispata]|uniref:Uncharacterized protein n=1 Tax=Elysia crispata TaxID=231223 RepID=A0AAE1AS32_9GAST|nr:hypothetical protein RRG08_060676 [Elysia crispata]